MASAVYTGYTPSVGDVVLPDNKLIFGNKRSNNQERLRWLKGAQKRR